MNPHPSDPHDPNDAGPSHRHDGRSPHPAADTGGAGLGEDGEGVSLVRARGLGDLVAAVPYLLTYVPRDAVAVLAFTGPRHRMTACLPLPRTPDLPLATYQLNRILARACRDADAGTASYALLVGYGTRAIEPVLAELAANLTVQGPDVIRVEEGRWWCLTCPNAACCPPGAPIPPIEDVSLALLVSGGVPASTRSHRARELQPAEDAVRGQVAQALAAGAATTATPPGEGYALLAAAKADRAEHRLEPSPDEAAALLLAVNDVRVRDACLLWEDRGALNLWLDLIRLAPPGSVAAVATLLALAVYRHGDGVLANLAIDRALDDDPRYKLARIVRDLLGIGIPPGQFAADLQEIADEVLVRLTPTSPDPDPSPKGPPTTGNNEDHDEVHDRRL